MRQATPTATLLASVMDVDDLESWIAEHRAEGWSFNRCAAEIYSLTGEYVSGETLRNWTARAAS